jgi:hypothetical protein
MNAISLELEPKPTASLSIVNDDSWPSTLEVRHGSFSLIVGWLKRVRFGRILMVASFRFSS